MPSTDPPASAAAPAETSSKPARATHFQAALARVAREYDAAVAQRDQALQRCAMLEAQVKALQRTHTRVRGIPPRASAAASPTQ